MLNKILTLFTDAKLFCGIVWLVITDGLSAKEPDTSSYGRPRSMGFIFTGCSNPGNPEDAPILLSDCSNPGIR